MAAKHERTERAQSDLARIADPIELRRERAIDRVFSQHLGEMEINRCPACNRIVRTPLARQCLWCGHTWRDL
jgi:hypothetical protein